MYSERVLGSGLETVSLLSNRMAGKGQNEGFCFRWLYLRKQADPSLESRLLALWFYQCKP